MRANFEKRPETAQVRVFAYEDRDSVDFIGFVEQRVPGLAALGDYGPHVCQFTSTVTLDECAEILYTVAVPGSVPPGTATV